MPTWGTAAVAPARVCGSGDGFPKKKLLSLLPQPRPVGFFWLLLLS